MLKGGLVFERGLCLMDALVLIIRHFQKSSIIFGLCCLCCVVMFQYAPMYLYKYNKCELFRK